MPPLVRLFSFGDDTLLEEAADTGALTVVTRWGEQVVPEPGAATVDALRRLALGPVTLPEVPDFTAPAPSRAPGPGDALPAVLDGLRCAIVHSLGRTDGGGPLASAVPDQPTPRLGGARVRPDSPVRLSRFATLRPLDGRLLLEAPGAPYRVVLLAPEARAQAAALAGAATPAGLARDLGLPPSLVTGLVGFLVAAGVVLLGDGEGFAEDRDPVRLGWGHHEMLFHHRTRNRQGERPADLVVDDAAAAPAPVTRPRPPGPRLDLDQHAGPPATTAPAPAPCDPRFTGGTVDGARLGALLYRSVRVLGTGRSAVLDGASGEVSHRPYLSLGCLYELELYLVAHRVTALPHGVHHYDPAQHALTMVGDDPDRVAALLDAATEATGSAHRPAVLVGVALRVPRVAWLLGGASYAMALVHSGAAAQAVHAAAGPLGLSVHLVPPLDGATDQSLHLTRPGEVCISYFSLETVAGDE